MIRHVVNDKGGLYNRVTGVIRLLPFSLGEAEAYLRSRQIEPERKQVLELYMAFGGIPLYLSMVPKGVSSTQAIGELCFTKDAFMVDEFERLLGALFDNHHQHRAVVETLARASSGLNRNELLRMSGIPNGGDATTIIRELEESGFVLTTREYGKRAKGRVYRLCDEYARFYLQWIEPVRTKIAYRADQNYWSQKMGSGAWNAWAGSAFEGICLKHVGAIKHALGIGGVLTYESSWRYAPPRGSAEQGAQIDLVIERADRVVNLVEIKFVSDELALSRDMAGQLAQRKEAFTRALKTRAQVLLTMLTTYGVRPGSPPAGVVDSQITMDALFR
jgi:hypothetical protein